MVSNEGLKGLEWKVVLSTISDWEDWVGNVGSQELAVPAFNLNEVPDPQAEPFGDYGLQTEGGSPYTVSNTDDFGKLQQPNHYQDSLHKYVIDKTARAAQTGHSGTVRDLEFELDISTITHSWQGLSSPMDLIAVNPFWTDGPFDKERMGSVVYQMNQITMDLGMMSENITLRGTLIDRDNPPHQATSGAPHIRKQQLLDIARGQWIGNQGVGTERGDNEQIGDKSSNMMTPNKWLALTIGRAHRRTQKDSNSEYVETYWTGDEPSDDIRGKERLRNDKYPLGTINNPNRRALTYGNNNHVGENWEDDHVLRDWDYKMHYEGRNRYRGAIRDITLNQQGGRPDVWDYNLTFSVVANETTVRHLEEG